MGILRTDRVSGLGGANAITGSVKFFGSNYISVGKSSDFALGTGDWTVEYWAYPSSVVSFQRHFYLIGSSSSNIDGIFANSSGISFGRTNVWAPSYVTHVIGRWNHYALVHDSTNMRLYINGTQALTSTDNFGTDSEKELIIGYSNSTFGGNFDGYISNFRIENGFARYTSAFTPPNTRLIKTENTTFLGLQSSGNVLQEETGKVIVLNRSTTDSTGPVASKFTPNSPVGFSTTTDVGSQYGSTFDGFGSFATSTYMVPPGGNTRERNRGRAVWMGGYAPSNYRTMIDFVNIQSLGNAVQFGQLSGTSVGEGSECSSSTRAIQGGGSLVNTMEFVTIANTSNTTNFGDLTVARRSLGSLSSETRGIWAGGTTNPAMSDVIDYVAIATAGDATDFGNLTVGRRNMGTAASPTRGVFAGGNPGSSPLTDDTIDYITIASTGNAIDFGNLSGTYREGAGCSNGTRGVFNVGSPGSDALNTMEYITIASTGDTTDFGDLFYAVGNAGGTSNGTRGVFGGGAGAAYTNIIQYITIATTGDAADFGDLTFTRIPYGATSDSHGGLS
tara:strand:- start:308 stop:1987 length:1680 start_codon:yes stop_codon:yes gene_type:complete